MARRRTLPPGRERPARRIASSTPLRASRPETVPAGRPVSHGPRLARIGVWTALAAGPLALTVALAAPSGTAAQAAPAPTPSATRPQADPAGTASHFVELWLRADAAAADNPVGAAVRAMAPQAELPARAREARAPEAVRVTALRTVRLPGGGWTVTVAAVTDEQHGPAPSTGTGTGTGTGTDKAAVQPAVRYFAVSGTGGKDDGPLVITGSPAEVAAPEAAPAGTSVFDRPVPSTGPLAVSLGDFLRTYLAGTGGQGAGLERYLSPGVRLTAPTAASYAPVEVKDVAADVDAAAGKDVPADGTKARVRARVEGADRAGTRWPFEYRLTVTARAGRWEISALDTGSPTHTPAAVASPSATPTATDGGTR
ncbi:conjugal transfer protein [Streptomyces sp. NPDC091259]|uniref:conjugal transfer protein n=1 Tax=Streptomyces sp. NPDC091259 TaxID=3365976 RepID=UPI003826485F